MSWRRPSYVQFSAQILRTWVKNGKVSCREVRLMDGRKERLAGSQTIACTLEPVAGIKIPEAPTHWFTITRFLAGVCNISDGRTPEEW